MKDMDKFLGVMFGGAIGDAFGAPVEFIGEGCFEPVNIKEGKIGLMQYGKDFGNWTDDTAMALLLADSLVRCGGFDIKDQIENYIKRKKTGYMGLKDYPEGIGRQVNEMLNTYISKGYWWSFSKCDIKQGWDIDMSGQMKDGNGSLMRIGPVALYYYDNAKDALKYAGESSKSTHNTDLCVLSCIYYTGLIWGALHGVSKEELMEGFYYPIKGYREFTVIPYAFQRIFNGEFREKKSERIKSTGYVIDSLETALWGFYHSTSYEDGLKMVIDKGGDADTAGCIYGYLAGAYYGYNAIPDYLKEGVAAKDFIRHTAEELYNHEYKEYDLSKIKPVVLGEHETRTWTNVLED